MNCLLKGLQVLLVGDGLNANEPVMTICERCPACASQSIAELFVICRLLCHDTLLQRSVAFHARLESG